MTKVLTLVLLIVLAIAPAALAQATPSPSPTGAAAQTGNEPRPPIFQYFLAGAMLALLVTILCMPTRKST